MGKFDKYCTVCLALQHHLVDCSETAALTHAAEYRGEYYRLCSENHLEVSVLDVHESICGQMPKYINTGKQ